MYRRHPIKQSVKCAKIRTHESPPTVMTTPKATNKKLNDCCVARATFSLPLNSAHLYVPSSDKTVICFLDGLELLWLPRSLCVAYHRIRPLGARK